MKSRGPILIALVLLACAGGWQMLRTRTEPKVAPTAVQSPKARPARDRVVASTVEQRMAKWDDLFKQVDRWSVQQIRDFPKTLKPSERMATLEALAVKFGPERIDNHGNWAVQMILRQWAEENFDDAWESCQQGLEGKVRGQLLGILVDILAKTDPQRALDLYSKAAKEERSITCELPMKLLIERAASGTETYLDLIDRLPFVETGGGNSLVFAEGFDFQKVSNRYRELIATNPPIDTPGALPSNFLRAWAERDPDAAYADWLNRGPLFFDNLSGLYEGVKTAVGEDAAAEWMAARLGESAGARERVITELAIMGVREKQADIIRMAGHFPEGDARDGFFTEILVAGGVRDPFDRYPELVAELSTPAALLETSRQMAAHRKVPDIDNMTDVQLQSWGVTREQLKAIFEKPTGP